MEYFLQLFFGGLSRGSVYALIALGYTMVYGIIELINFAHGEIYMIGAFMGLIVAGVLTTLGWPVLSILAIALVVSVLYSAAYGYTVEKIAYKPCAARRAWPRSSRPSACRSCSRTTSCWPRPRIFCPFPASSRNWPSWTP